MTLRLGSLCTGYGGLDLAVAQVLDVTRVWHAENDVHASSVLAHHYPHVPNLGDITTVDWVAVEPVDVVCFGFPCQDLSYAGRGAGITEGTRSGLWYSCWDAVRVLRPRHVIVENVAALLVRRPGFDVVAADMAADGYDLRWTCLRASDVGAPHARNRVWIVATDASGARTGRDGRAVSGTSGGARRAGLDVHSAVDARAAAADPFSTPRWRPGDAASGWSPTAPGGWGTVGRREAPADPDGERLTLWPELDGDTLELPLATPRRDDPDGLGAPAWGVYGPAIARWERVLGRTPPAPTDQQGRLNPVFVEWMMGLPAGWVTAVPGIPRTAQLRILGNGVVPLQGAAAIGSMLAQWEAAA